MGFISWLAGVLGRSTVSLDMDGWCNDPAVLSLYAEAQARELAFETAVGLISGCIRKCEFKTRHKGKQIREKEWFLWNVEPNINQSSSAFLHKLIRTLYLKGEALVLVIDDQLLVADSYARRKYAVYPDHFDNVVIGDWKLDGNFYGDDVLFFTLGEKNVKQVLDLVTIAHTKLLSYSINAYRQSRGRKGVFTLDAMAAGKEDEKEFAMLQQRFKSFFEADNAVMPLKNGQKYDELDSKTYSSDTTRDIRSLVDDIQDFTARAFGIPPVLMRGDVAGIDGAMDLLLTTCVDPLVVMLEEEINRKRNGYDGLRRGTWLTIDTTAIKHIDLLTMAPSIDKLISSGVQSVNDIRRLIGQEEIDEDWANKHFITKNYIGLDEAQGLEDAPKEGGT